MRAKAPWIAIALLAACGKEEPPREEPPRVEAPAEPEPPRPAEPEPEEDPAAERTYEEAVEARARARALRTQLGERRTALAAALAAADGPRRDVLLLVHELTAREVFAAERLLAVDTALERADAHFTAGRHADAGEAFANARGGIEALLAALDRSEPKARAILDLRAAEQTVETTRAWFDEQGVEPPEDLLRAREALAKGRGLVDSLDFEGARACAGEVPLLCERARQRVRDLLAALDAAAKHRGPAEVALAAWERYSLAGGETDLSRAARKKLEEADRLLAVERDAAAATKAYEEAALAFEKAIEAAQVAERTRLAGLRVKKTPPPEPPTVKGNAKVGGAVLRALDWLARHQDDDGRWDSDAFTKHDPGAERTGGGKALFDVGVTALALLCFLEAGYGEGPENPYTINIAEALRFLRAAQDDVGVYGGQASKHFIYNHAIATMAVCEALRRGGDATLRTSAMSAVDFLESARSADLGWRYEPRGKESDTSVTAWCVRALAAARDAGLEVEEEAFRGALAWVDKMTDPNFGEVGYNFPGGSVSRSEGMQLRFPAEQSQAMTAAGLLVRILCGENPKLSSICRKHADLLLEYPPRWDEERGSIDMYYWYYGTLAMRRAAGSRWRDWRTPLHAACLDRQVREGAQAGSWDPAGAWGEEGGRVYATAIMTLTLLESAPAIAR